MAIRLKDIAEDLGLSSITISKVLRGKADVSQATRARVLKRVKELNYRPNMLARGLASGRSSAVGLIVPDLVQPFFAELARSLAAVLRRNGYALLLASSEGRPEIEREELRTIAQRGVDVILLASCRGSTSMPQELIHPSAPCVLIDRNLPRLRLPFIGCDDVVAGELATDHLAALGRRRIAHIGGVHTSPALDRAKGYALALAKRGLPQIAAYLVSLEGLEEQGETAGRQAMQRLLRLRQRPDAVFCYNDLAAIGAVEAVLAAGLGVPEDVAVIGCGNLRYAEYFRVPLSTVDQRIPELGSLAGEFALLVARDPAASPGSRRLEPRLVLRRSTQPGD